MNVDTTLNQVAEDAEMPTEALRPAAAQNPNEYLAFVKVNNQTGLIETLKGEHNESDLVSGVYEGGLKVWECSLDLVDFIAQNANDFKGKTVLELGCGQGLPGVMAMRAGAANVAF